MPEILVVEDSESDLAINLSHAEFSFSIRNERRLINAAVQFIQDAARRFGRLSASERTRLAIGLEEALSNAMIHGNLEVSSELRQNDSNAWGQLIALRSKQRPYCERTIEISVCIADDQLTCRICDQGSGFDVASVPDPTNPETLTRPGGRGLLLIRSFMDEVFHNQKGNQITLCKKLPAPSTVDRRPVDTNGPTMDDIAELCASEPMQAVH